MNHCPNTEDLVAYATRALDRADGAVVERHLRGCASCVSEVQTTVRRTRAMQGEAISLPPGLTAAATAAAAGADSSPLLRAISGTRRASRHRRAAWQATRSWLPLAAAAALVLFIGVSSLSRHEPDGIRGPGDVQTLRVTAPSADVRGAPSVTAERLARVPRGGAVAIVNERGEWYYVRLADGTEGWMDRVDFD